MFEGKNILVAGGTGTIGAQVVEQLLAKQANVTVVSMDDEEYALKVLGPDVIFKKYDLTDADNCKTVVKNQDMVFNLVGIKGSVGIGETKVASYLVPMLRFQTNLMEASFLTTAPEALDFIPKKNNCFYIPNPSDNSFETLNNFNKSCNVDVFFALSHGVHRGKLKSGKVDDRITFLNKLQSITSNTKFDIYGINKIQPIWADHYFKTIENAKMGLNLSRGKAIKYYSSDRITQIVGNGLVCLIDERTQYKDFFTDKEMVFYRSINDLSEKIIKISRDEKLRKTIARNGKNKYMKYFNSDLVAEFIINKTLNLKNKKKYLWHNE